ncbi:MAG: AAA family ATPase, partial [Gammaproteobacteria bacterium]|nr:AAA family ATPase [Gammaproteobacteria bacterium]
MPKTNKVEYVCRSCGSQFPKWAGQCSECLEWNTLEEMAASTSTQASKRFSGYAGDTTTNLIKKLDEVSAEKRQRTTTGLSELDRVLGGGMVEGSVVLIGGDPGIGKSTLLTQTMAYLSDNMNCLYVSGEESAEQISLRARRLNLPVSELKLLTETC